MIKKYFAIGIGAITVFKIVAIFLTNYSLFGDEAQYWLWSQNLDIGYFSNPDLIAWFLSGHIRLFGDSFFFS